MDELQICRACLSPDVVVNQESEHFEELFKIISQLSVRGLRARSHGLCGECAVSLSLARQFRARARRADELLTRRVLAALSSPRARRTHFGRAATSATQLNISNWESMRRYYNYASPLSHIHVLNVGFASPLPHDHRYSETIIVLTDDDDDDEHTGGDAAATTVIHSDHHNTRVTTTDTEVAEQNSETNRIPDVPQLQAPVVMGANASRE